MSGLESPYEETPKPAPGQKAQVLAGYLITFLNLKVTDSQRDDIARVIQVALKQLPWIKDVPGIEKWID